MSITNRGKKWELLNSWWVLLSFFILGFISLIYIGYKAKVKRWKILSIIYFFLTWVYMLSLDVSNLPSIFAYIPMLTYVSGIVYCFVVREEYLIRRDFYLSNPFEIIDEHQYRNTKKEFYIPLNEEIVDNKSDLYKKEDLKLEAEDSIYLKNKVVENNKIDINNSTADELSKLPGITVVKAKKIADYINRNNGFKSMDEFIKLMEIKPHFAVQILDMAYITEYKNKKDDIADGRILDI